MGAAVSSDVRHYAHGFMKPSDTFSIFTPQPRLSLADTSRMRVRAEVEERDLGRIRTSQQVIIRSAAFNGKTLTGRVNRIGSQMERKKVRAIDAAEKATGMSLRYSSISTAPARSWWLTSG